MRCLECLVTSKPIFSDQRTQAALLIAPAIVIYIVFAIYPMVNVVALSFQHWNGLDANKEFVGLDNSFQTLHTGVMEELWLDVRTNCLDLPSVIQSVESRP